MLSANEMDFSEATAAALVLAFSARKESFHLC